MGPGVGETSRSPVPGALEPLVRMPLAEQDNVLRRAPGSEFSTQSRRNPTCHQQWHSHGSGSPEAIQTAYHTKCPWSPCGQENAATSQRPDLSLDLSVESFLQ